MFVFFEQRRTNPGGSVWSRGSPQSDIWDLFFSFYILPISTCVETKVQYQLRKFLHEELKNTKQTSNQNPKATDKFILGSMG